MRRERAVDCWENPYHIGNVICSSKLIFQIVQTVTHDVMGEKWKTVISSKIASRISRLRDNTTERIAKLHVWMEGTIYGRLKESEMQSYKYMIRKQKSTKTWGKNITNKSHRNSRSVSKKMPTIGQPIHRWHHHEHVKSYYVRLIALRLKYKHNQLFLYYKHSFDASIRVAAIL